MFDHITDAIKAPDIVRLRPNLYLARFETMKVYSTLVAVERLLRTGVVNKGDTLVDSSSGLYALSLALACHRYGMKCHIVASKVMDKALTVQLEILGATVEQVQSAPTLKLDQSQRVETIRQLLATNPHIHWMQQYHNDIHYAGYEPIAELIETSIGVDNLTIVGAVGSGASTGGLATHLRRRSDDVQLVGIQPFGSVTFGSEHIEDPDILIAGFGSAIPFRNVRHELYDRLHWVSFGYGLSGSIALLRRHAIFAGLSSGCCYLVASHEALLRADRNVLLIAADTGHRYIESVFTRYAEGHDIDHLAPKAVAGLDDLALPWCVMEWNRSSAELHRRAVDPSDMTAC